MIRRVGLYIDAQNLYSQAIGLGRDLGFTTPRPDYIAIRDAVEEILDDLLVGMEWELIHTKVFTVARSSPRKLIEALAAEDIQVEVHTHKDQEVCSSCGNYDGFNFDVTMVTEIMTHVLQTPAYVDTVVIATSDRAFLPLLDKLTHRGVVARAVAVTGTIPRELLPFSEELPVSVIYDATAMANMKKNVGKPAEAPVTSSRRKIIV